MKAIRMHEPTGIDGLVFEEVPDAAPMACDVLVKVAACGITHNELDWPLWTCRAGHRRSSIIPGHEVSGVVAGLGYNRSPALLRPGGTLVVIKADAPRPAGRDDITTVVFIQESSRGQLTELARLVDEGHLRPQVGPVYPLAEAAQAYRAKAAGGVPGRVILRP
jgi:NADPH:quinone reductase-like Zn-dependent oxidoreductase